MARRFPFPLPNGWFAVAWADELEPGGVRPLRYFGRDLVLFRSEEGRAHVLDAYCPHLGAHLGHGGAVEGESLRCPFHGWTFDGAGRCTGVPYAERIPTKASLPSWPVTERNGYLYVWHHAGGEEPWFDVPVVPEVGHADWSPLRKYRWRVRSRNQELAENSVDRAHFRYVHGMANVPDAEVSVEGHVLRSLSRGKMPTPRGVVEGAIDSQSHGFGSGFTRFTGIAETVLVASASPVDEEEVDVRFAFTVKSAEGYDADRGVGAAIIQNIVQQMEEDIPIWENKIYRPRPVLCDGDGPIMKLRRWAQQFYSGEAEARA